MAKMANHRIAPILTSPWANAIQSDAELEKIDYPDLKGMKVSILIPNDYYRKKVMPLGPGYIGTTLRRCGIDVNIVDCSAHSYDDIEIAKTLIQSGVRIFAIGALYPMFKEVERLCNIIRAVIPVHNLGFPARAVAIGETCARYNITLIEDAAESLGSFRDGIHTGRAGCMGTLSFNGNKIITTGGGGAVITDDETIADKAKHLTTTAKQPHPWLFLHDEVGFNYRLPNLNAALGCAQIEQLPDYIERKRRLANSYQQWFADKEPELVLEPQGARSNYRLNAVLLKDREERDRFLEYTNEHGVMTRPMWTPMHTLPMYQNCQRGDLTIAENIESRLVNIPSSVI